MTFKITYHLHQSVLKTNHGIKYLKDNPIMSNNWLNNCSIRRNITIHIFKTSTGKLLTEPFYSFQTLKTHLLFIWQIFHFHNHKTPSSIKFTTPASLHLAGWHSVTHFLRTNVFNFCRANTNTKILIKRHK